MMQKLAYTRADISVSKNQKKKKEKKKETGKQ